MTGELITFPIRLYARGVRLALGVAEDVTGKAVMGTLRVAGALGNLRGGGGATEAPPSEPPAPPRPPEQRSRPSAPAQRRPPARPRRAPAEAPVQAPPPPAADLPQPDPRIAERVEREPPPAQPPRPPARPRARPAASNGNAEPLASERLAEEQAAPAVDLESPAPAAPDHVSESPTLVRESAEPGVEEGVGPSITVQEPWDGYGRMPARDVVGRLSALSAAQLAAVQLYEAGHRKRPTVLKAVERELANQTR